MANTSDCVNTVTVVIRKLFRVFAHNWLIMCGSGEPTFGFGSFHDIRKSVLHNLIGAIKSTLNSLSNTFRLFVFLFAAFSVFIITFVSFVVAAAAVAAAILLFRSLFELQILLRAERCAGVSGSHAANAVRHSKVWRTFVFRRNWFYFCCKI